MNVAVLGTGMMGRTHLEAFKRLSGVNVVGVFSRDRKHAVKPAEDFTAKVFEDWREALSSPDVHAIDVCLPTHCHSEIIYAALLAGKHVLCETPMAASYEAAEELSAMAKTAGRHLGVAMLIPWVSKFQRLRDHIGSGALGAVVGGSVSRMSAPYRKPGNAGHHGDALLELGTFDFVALDLLLGSPAAVHAARRREAPGICDHVGAVLEFENGTLLNFEVSAKLPAGLPYRSRMELVCERGVVELSFSLPSSGAPVSVLSIETPEGKEALEVADRDPYLEEIRHFVDCVNENRPLGPMDADVAVRAARVEAAVRTAAMKQERV